MGGRGLNKVWLLRRRKVKVVSLRLVTSLTPQTKVLVPPCIRKHSSGGSEVRLEIEDRVHRPALVKVSADHVRIHITSNISSDNAQPVSDRISTHCMTSSNLTPASHAALQEILQMMAKALNARLTQLQLVKGTRSRSRWLVVEHLQPNEVFERLQKSVGSIQTAAAEENEAKARAGVGLPR
jgi:uncharacterized protein YggU (UPF0235/DUF167 family)